MSEDRRFKQLKEEMVSKFFGNNPHFASFIGLHDPYDYLLPRGDTAHIVGNLRILEDYVKRMKETLDFNSLNDANRIDWQVLEKALERGKFDFYECRKHELNPDAFDEIGSIFFLMITRDYSPLEKRIDAMIARIKKLPKYLEEFRSRFEQSRPVKLWTEVAIESAQQIPGLFKYLVMSTKEKIPEELHRRLDEACASLEQPFQKHMRWLRKLKSKTIDNWALGNAKFERLIKIRDLGMSSEEINQLGFDYLKKLKKEREKIAVQISPDKSVEEVMRIIESNAPRNFEEALNATRQHMEEAKIFINEKNIVTIHEEDRLIVAETPAFAVPLIPFAAMFMPSRFDKPMTGVYIVTRPKKIENIGNHLNYANIRNTAVHEAFPGHFLQGAVSNRSSLIHIFADGTETVEGWAHYCEQMMTEHGFIRSLESRLIQTNDAIWRAVRVIVDVGLSRGEMRFEEAVNMLMKEAGISREGAVAEVRRYTQTPGYALSYLLGKHLILQLRQEIRQRMGKEYNEKAFHDTITENGYLPIALLRKVFNARVRIKSQ